MDLIKAIACVIIVLHHLSAYGPMATVVAHIFPDLTEWFYDYGRIAVQAFLVTSGFLVARNIAPEGVLLVPPLLAVQRRYVRLTVPYFSALILAILCAAFARTWMDHDFIPAPPDIYQVIAHIFLMQDLLKQEALSVGVWYIAIDFQLFSLTVFLLWAAGHSSEKYISKESLGKISMALLSILSLFIVNRDRSWDDTALYFFGSYGVGMFCYWASNSQHKLFWFGLLLSVILAALAVEFRYRLAVVGFLTLILGAASLYATEKWRLPGFLSWLGRVSYSIFLTHFPVLLIGNTLLSFFFTMNPMVNIFVIVLTLVSCIFVASLFHDHVECMSFSYKEKFVFPTWLLAVGLLLADL